MSGAPAGVAGTRQKWMLERIEETFVDSVTTEQVDAFLKTNSKMVDTFLRGEAENVVFVYFQPAPNYEVDHRLRQIIGS
jgi:hypothetical protein